MSRLELLKTKKDDIYRIVNRYHGNRVFVFGSCARKEETPESDIDLMIEFDDQASLLDHSNILCEITDLLNTKVDVVSSRGLHPYIARRIWKDAVVL